MANCRSCGAEIVWALTASKRRIPLDAKPEKRLVKIDTLQERDGPDINQVALRDTWMSHFATCPNADQHRKPKESVPG